MKNLYTIVAMMLLASLSATAQVSIDEEKTTTTETRSFDNEMKTQEVDANFYSKAEHRAKRAAIRK